MKSGFHVGKFGHAAHVIDMAGEVAFDVDPIEDFVARDELERLLCR